LTDGQDVGTHKKPTKDWVDRVLFRKGSPDLFRLVSPGRGPGKLATQPTGNSVQEVIAFGFGRSDGADGNTRREKAVAHKDFTLLQSGINIKKGVWFGRNLASGKDRMPALFNKPEHTRKDATWARNSIREVSIGICPHFWLSYRENMSLRGGSGSCGVQVLGV
jgi:hypothetical protein